MINNEYDIIGSKRIEGRISELLREVNTLKQLGNIFSGESAEWLDGVVLIRDSYFTEYAKQLASKSKDLTSWPLPYINWEEATSALLKDYENIDFDGVTYWVKKPIR